LQEALKDFEPSNVDDFLAIQSEQHQLDDYFRQKAIEFN
jgi:hypothetical protein